MRYISYTRHFALHLKSLVSLDINWKATLIAIPFIIASVTMSPAQVAIDEDGVLRALGDPALCVDENLDIEIALALVEKELGFTVEESSWKMNQGLHLQMLASAEHTAAYLYHQRNNQLRAQAAIAALQSAKDEAELRNDLQKVQLQLGQAIPTDEFYALQEELETVNADFKVLHAALETACVVSAFRSDNAEACDIVLGETDETN